MTFLILCIKHIYIIHFSHISVSNKPNDWTDFSNYLGPFISLANLCVFVYFTRLVYFYSLTRDKILNDFERPLIAFSKTSELDKYSILNVGKGAAINIYVKSHLDHEKLIWNEVRVSYSLETGASKPMNWTTNCNALCAIYEDIFGNKYISFMEDDKLSFIDTSSKMSLNQFANQIMYSKLEAKQTLWFS